MKYTPTFLLQRGMTNADMKNNYRIMIFVIGVLSLAACTTFAPPKSSGNARVKVITYADNNAYKAVVESITRISDGMIVYRGEDRGITQLYTDLKAGTYRISHTCISRIGKSPEYSDTFDLTAGQFVKMRAKIAITLASGAHCKAEFYNG